MTGRMRSFGCVASSVDWREFGTQGEYKTDYDVPYRMEAFAACRLVMSFLTRRRAFSCLTHSLSFFGQHFDMYIHTSNEDRPQALISYPFFFAGRAANFR